VATAPDIPGYRVGGVLGAGGFATVYRCWQLAVGREVAVKVDNRMLISGAASAEPLACHVAHVWETFAIAILPAEARTYDQPAVAADPPVRRVCSEAVMLASRQGPARRLPAPNWDIQVLPPSEAAYDSGSRVYRCLANEIGHEPRTSQFRR
jgi:hypothetical protein